MGLFTAGAKPATPAVGSSPNQPSWETTAMQHQKQFEAQLQDQRQADVRQESYQKDPQEYRNPFNPVLVPVLPDMQAIPDGLTNFRDQCAAGVRQAVAMITAMEHQLSWERSRRQQAEEDCKVLLGAVDLERGAAGQQLSHLEGSLRDISARMSGSKLAIPAEELPKAHKAAETIQKVFRGNAARKEFEGHLKDILRSVDPSLDPSNLSAVAQSHISNVNMRNKSDGGVKAVPGGDLDHARRDVAAVKRRMRMLKDAGLRTTDTEEDTELKAILQDGYPASSARVVAALARRCRELQSALVEAAEQLEEAHMSITGLSQNNGKVAELSQVRMQLQEEQQARSRLQNTVAKLRNIIVATTKAQDGDPSSDRYNPYIAAWYRKAHASQEFSEYPPKGFGLRNGVYLLDGPDAEVEFWDDLRSGAPEPVVIAKEDTQQYKDLLSMQQDMVSSAQRDFVDPLFSAAVPDTTFFQYRRDTPIMPVVSPHNMIRENMDTGYDRPQGPNSLQAHLPIGTQQGVPVQPMYSLLPLIQESQHMSQAPDYHPGFSPQPPTQQPAYSLPQQQPFQLTQPQPHHGYTPGYTPPTTPPEFDYLQHTPRATLSNHPKPVLTIQPLLRDQHPIPPQSVSPHVALQPTQVPPHPTPPQILDAPLSMAQPPQPPTTANWTPGYTPPGTPPNFSYYDTTPRAAVQGLNQHALTIQPLLRDQSRAPPTPPPPEPQPLQTLMTERTVAAPSPAIAPPATAPVPPQQPVAPLPTGVPLEKQQQQYPRLQTTPGYTPSRTPPDFEYSKETPQVPLSLPGQPRQQVRTALPLLRDVSTPQQVAQQQQRGIPTAGPMLHKQQLMLLQQQQAPPPPSYQSQPQQQSYLPPLPQQQLLPTHLQPVQQQQQQTQPQQLPSGVPLQQQYNSQAPGPQGSAFTPGYTPPVTPPNFNYNQHTPQVPVSKAGQPYIPHLTNVAMMADTTYPQGGQPVRAAVPTGPITAVPIRDQLYGIA
ncbi:hypothetical protein CEUSTIGMA_g1123.t1 [Chlamydomonas eustigma]|uniref:Uncharacterized protein n=1 Tax=Chlamydomonas eustigma TaxID=1157962 RepID=A0A250WSN9_9CHLO|nr:hypothetical protein CEUSTIGMA_g1123.t1 [Chlamydomonas eustigma]|eukprot:GAX73672.1 hypothetical protein CEUSTIGMA_g1123.t1 [Chlamydomonas eustigma]